MPKADDEKKVRHLKEKIVETASFIGAAATRGEFSVIVFLTYDLVKLCDELRTLEPVKASAPKTSHKTPTPGKPK